ncbi:MAG: RluA family pseudouridine synthase [Planctomycetota bacterium]
MPKYSIIFEDDYLIVVNKPSGLLVIPTPKDEKNTLTNLLNDYLQSKSSAPDSAKAHPCHRLDRDTSGLILYAKGKSMQQKMMSQFYDKKVAKKYLAFIQGKPAKENGTINYKLEGQEALTKYSVVKYYSQGYSLVEVELVTGRTNQIRLHFKMLGHPIVGERRFAFAKDYQIKSKRLTLHSSSISFYHPITNEKISFTCDMPDDMNPAHSFYGGKPK